MPTTKTSRMRVPPRGRAKPAKRRPSAEQREIAELSARIDRRLDELQAEADRLLRELDARRGT